MSLSCSVRKSKRAEGLEEMLLRFHVRMEVSSSPKQRACYSSLEHFLKPHLLMVGSIYMHSPKADGFTCPFIARLVFPPRYHIPDRTRDIFTPSLFVVLTRAYFSRRARVNSAPENARIDKQRVLLCVRGGQD